MMNNDAGADTMRDIADTIFAFKSKNFLSKNAYAETADITNSILESMKSKTTALLSLSKLRTYDLYTFSHSINVFYLSVTIGSMCGLDQRRLFDLGMSAILHDIGKMNIPKRILNKRSKLTDSEFTMIKTHASEGFSFVKKNISIPEAAFPGILHHHEKYNGTGYPVGIKGEQIDLFARIISVADVYDAMTSNRPYRKALTHNEAIGFIRDNSGIHFDPKIASVFLDSIAAGG